VPALRAGEHARKQRGGGGTNVAAVGTDDSGKHERYLPPQMARLQAAINNNDLDAIAIQRERKAKFGRYLWSRRALGSLAG
jgi:hypothetical protein